MRAGRWVTIFSAAALLATGACAGLLDIGDVRYPVDGGGVDDVDDGPAGDVGSPDAPTADGEGHGVDAGDAAAPPSDASIFCQGTRCLPATQECCLAWGGVDTCVAGHPASCVAADANVPTTIAECDDSTDCLAFVSGGPVCCFQYDPAVTQFTTKCVPACSGPNNFIACDKNASVPCASGACKVFSAGTGAYTVCR
jgi:hypothetical protein